MSIFRKLWSSCIDNSGIIIIFVCDIHDNNILDIILKVKTFCKAIFETFLLHRFDITLNAKLQSTSNFMMFNFVSKLCSYLRIWYTSEKDGGILDVRLRLITGFVKVSIAFKAIKPSFDVEYLEIQFCSIVKSEGMYCLLESIEYDSSDCTLLSSTVPHYDWLV